MKQLIPAALAILMPFVFERIQILKDKRLQLKRMNKTLKSSEN